ncbi:hypothetical protein MMJ62_12960, partial [Enterococcus cecorum]|uniref:hypothetical protein n=1 Tax=Enterococcus cecorum TaxID=44008 RepID=UPI001FAE554F
FSSRYLFNLSQTYRYHLSLKYQVISLVRHGDSASAFALAFLEYSISKFVIKIKKDRHGLDGQQDEFHELNLFTNDSIIGWKVPTNLGASSALTVSHQYSNCIIKIINFPNISIFY